MQKIATLFDRDWEGDRKVVPYLSRDAQLILGGLSHGFVATEKLDGTNVRLTVRKGEVVRVEKRRNPSKDQKQRDIVDPWYVDTHAEWPEDRAITEAAANVALTDVADGEWPGEAIGPKIQGNPLQLEEHRVVLFSAGQAPVLNGCPRLYDGSAMHNTAASDRFEALREYILTTPSYLNPAVPIEGIVWHNAYGDDLKLKAKDFR